VGTRTCRVCGADITRRHKLAIYCKACAASKEATRKRGGQPAPERVTECSVCGTDISDRHPLAARCKNCQAAHRRTRTRKRKLVGERNCTECRVSIRGYAKGKTRCTTVSRSHHGGASAADRSTWPGSHGCAASPAGSRTGIRLGRRRTGRSTCARGRRTIPLKVQLWERRRCARERGLEFEITLGDLEAIWPQDNRCPVCGVELTREHRSAANGSIDRIDNTRGHTAGNVHIVCAGCNGKTSDHTVEQLAAGRAGPEWRSWSRKRLGRPERRVVRAGCQP
jgi:hypothetical protein